jgi:glycosyltransferase involved in cell wall biosynthesis
MNILFLHRNFPAQFKHLVSELTKNQENKIVFLTTDDKVQISGVEKVLYKPSAQQNCHEYLTFFEDAVSHAKAAAQEALKLKENGFIPDVIYGHNWGETMFMKDVFPDVPLICYFEWFYNTEGADFNFLQKNQSFEKKEKSRCKNAYILQDLCSCDAGISPTQWQKNQFPKEFHNKIKVIHDGINTEICKPDENAKCKVQSVKCHCDERKIQKREFTAKNEVITYTTRGMEPYRGFPQFMKALEILQKKRPKLQAIIAGNDEVYYGMKMTDATYKETILKEFDIDLSRVYFTGFLPFDEYIKILQISSVHVYLTVPFVLSWSILEAMSCGCCIVASNTPPVLEVVKDNYNGLLFDFFNINQLVEKVEYALDNSKEADKIGRNARQTIIKNYNKNILVPQQINFIKRFIP